MFGNAGIAATVHQPYTPVHSHGTHVTNAAVPLCRCVCYTCCRIVGPALAAALPAKVRCPKSKIFRAARNSHPSLFYERGCNSPMRAACTILRGTTEQQGQRSTGSSSLPIFWQAGWCVLSMEPRLCECALMGIYRVHGYCSSPSGRYH